MVKVEAYEVGCRVYGGRFEIQRFQKLCNDLSAGSFPRKGELSRPILCAHRLLKSVGIKNCWRGPEMKNPPK